MLLFCLRTIFLISNYSIVICCLQPSKEAELQAQVEALKKTVSEQAQEIASLKEQLAKYEADSVPAEEE